MPVQVTPSSTRVAWETAAETCAASPVDCADYHRLWPLLRLLGLGSGPGRHLGFFTDVVRRAGRPDGAPRVLVSGCADEAMLEVVLDARSDAEVAVLDRCPTPLELCRRAARTRGREVRTICGDVAAPEPEGEGSLDLVITHSFLSQFTDQDKVRVLRCWRTLLAAGDHVVTATRLDPDATTRRRFDADAASALAEAVTARAARHPDPWVRSLGDELAEVAERYAASIEIFSVTDADALRGLFDRAGFTEIDLVVRALPGASGPATGPGMRRAADYAEISAAAGA